MRAYLLKEELQLLWDYTSVTWAAKFLDGWYSKVMRSRLEPMKALAKSFRAHRELLLNWFRARGEVSASGLRLKGISPFKRSWDPRGSRGTPGPHPSSQHSSNRSKVASSGPSGTISPQLPSAA